MKNFAKRISALVLAVVVSAAVLCPAAFAAQLPSLPKDQCVVDDANALNSQVTQTIEELNAKLETNCKGAQIGVLTVQYTGNLSTEDYATEAFNAWGIGNATNNNGVLILLVMESAQYADGDYYLTYGDGFRNTTLAKQASAIAQTMESDFANRDYSDAVITCANNVADTIASIYGVNLDNGSYENGSTVQPGYQGGQSSGGSTLTDILTLVVSVILLIVIIRSMAYVFASPCGWLWCFGGPRPPRGRWRGPHNPPPPPPGGFYGGSRGPRPPRGGFGGMGGGSFGGGAGRGGFGGGSFGGGFGGMGGGSSHGGGGGRGR
ncbi:MAG: TPM domain-containing protein [Faecalibacterium sp.]|nr:TPM domain-containing protein [Faecalibacterium sp.]